VNAPAAGARALAAGLAVLGAGAAGRVLAAPEEIQVYVDDMSAPGRFGLDVHTNVVATGDAAADFAGQQSSVGRLRVTPEFAYGLTPWLEAGLYLPLASVDRSGRVGLDGAKVRLKYIAPKTAGQDWFWGANFEIGRVDHHLDANPWNAELKAILGRRYGRWTLAANANLDFKVAGPAAAPASLELATMITCDVGRGLSLGVESYNGVGELRNLGDLAGAEHSTFFVINRSFGRWDVNLGVGGGYGTNGDGLIVKAIIGVPIG
jgi:hypothetical protein